MKKTIQRLFILLLSCLIFTSCQSKKSKEPNIVLDGNFLEADKPAGSDDELPTMITSGIKWKFDKNGDVSYSYTKSYPSPTQHPTKDNPEPIDSNSMNFLGKWEIKDNKLTFVFDKLKADEKSNLDEKEDQASLCEYENKIFNSLDIISFDSSKLVFRDNNGQKHIVTKSME